MLWVILLIAIVGAAVFYLGETFNTHQYAGTDYHGRGYPL